MTRAHAMMIVFALASFATAWSMWCLHRSNNKFSLTDLLMENGRASRLAVILMGSFGLTTFIMLWVTFTGKITETWMLTYGGIWVAPVIAKMFGIRMNGAPPTTADIPQLPKPSL